MFIFNYYSVRPSSYRLFIQLLRCETFSLFFCFSFFNHYGMRPSPHCLFLIITVWGLLLIVYFQLLQCETFSSLSLSIITVWGILFDVYFQLLWCEAFSCLFSIITVYETLSALFVSIIMVWNLLLVVFFNHYNVRHCSLIILFAIWGF